MEDIDIIVATICVPEWVLLTKFRMWGLSSIMIFPNPWKGIIRRQAGQEGTAEGHA